MQSTVVVMTFGKVRESSGMRWWRTLAELLCEALVAATLYEVYRNYGTELGQHAVFVSAMVPAALILVHAMVSTFRDHSTTFEVWQFKRIAVHMMWVCVVWIACVSLGFCFIHIPGLAAGALISVLVCRVGLPRLKDWTLLMQRYGRSD